MRYLIDKIATRDNEWLIVSQTDSSGVEVWEDGSVIEFPSERQAYLYVLDRHRQATDLRQFKPGQELELPMADGTLKKYRIVENNPQNITLEDQVTGEEALVPHFQPGAQPNIIQPGQKQPGIPQPGQTQQQPSEYSMQEPNEYATALSASDFRKKAEMWNIIGVNTNSSFQHPEVLWIDGRITRETFDDLPIEAQQLIKKIRNGDRINRWQEIDDVRSWQKTAEPQMPLQQAMPAADALPPEKPPPDFSESIHTFKDQNTGGGAEQKRPLSRHEIIEEAETLIRNALYKGIRVGTWDLVNYMTQYYSNDPDELYEGADFAWKKVQYEEPEIFGEATGPGPSQSRPRDTSKKSPNVPGAEPGAQPDIPEETELSGPIQVKL